MWRRRGDGAQAGERRRGDSDGDGGGRGERRRRRRRWMRPAMAGEEQQGRARWPGKRGEQQGRARWPRKRGDGQSRSRVAGGRVFVGAAYVAGGRSRSRGSPTEES